MKLIIIKIMVLEIVQEGIQEAIEIREVVVLLAVQSIIVLEIVVHHVDLVQGGEMSLQ